MSDSVGAQHAAHSPGESGNLSFLFVQRRALWIYSERRTVGGKQ